MEPPTETPPPIEPTPGNATGAAPATESGPPPVGSPVTLNIVRRVKPGREQEFESFVDGIMAATARAPGFVDARRVPTPRGDPSS